MQKRKQGQVGVEVGRRSRVKDTRRLGRIKTCFDESHPLGRKEGGEEGEGRGLGLELLLSFPEDVPELNRACPDDF